MQKRWLARHTRSLAGKTVAITGSTGGLGRELCRYLASLGASLVLVDRSNTRSEANKARLLAEFPDVSISTVTADLADMTSVRTATEQLLHMPLDLFIHNAGAYHIPRHICDTGYDNVFQINFISPYYMIRTLLPLLKSRGGRVMAVGSIAHRYSKTDPSDVDFSTRERHSLAYGNAKRYLMFALPTLCRDFGVPLAITHPGITFTGITNHYPPVIFALIKHPMKVIFMRPAKAALSLLAGVFESCDEEEWIGPRLFDVWGRPKKRRLTSCNEAERNAIIQTAQDICNTLSQ